MTARTQAAGAAADKERAVPPEWAADSRLKVRRARWLALSMLSLSILLVALGVYTATRAENLSVSGYGSGVILTLGSFLALLGLCLEENRHQLLTAAIVFLSVGVVAAFLCLLVDGAGIALSMDMRPLKAGRCQYYSSGGGNGYVYENFYTSVSCWSPTESCNMSVRSGTCYCCDLYDCANGGYLSGYYEFVGVDSCQQVITLHLLVWALTFLNLVSVFGGVLSTAVLGSVKHLRTSSPAAELTASSPTAPLLMEPTHSYIHQL
ncbi:transmembrane protein 255B [Nelusetta ayraudi]|uniref:transmembrane protein 255B n=1 Tax=Nelusetta ayraudi TaxID=303726 RepID=UPI003F71A287